jgi:2-octaprenyl-6-methoxyphenol hydroxylase
MNNEYDIVIVGGGLVGTTLALALAISPWRIALVESHIPQQHSIALHDMRALALSYSSQQIFQRLNIWEEIQSVATPIKKIHVSEKKRFGNTLLDAHDIELDAFGYVVPIQLLYDALQHEIAKVATQSRNDSHAVTLLRPASVTAVKQVDKKWQLTINEKSITTTLLIAADGEKSFIREALQLPTTKTEYQQTAIVTNCALSKPHEFTAYERFTPQGTLAMMPMLKQRSAIIWAMPNELAETMLTKSDTEFLLAVQQAFGYRLGKLSDLGKRQSYPLRELHAEQQSLPGLILLGNAAHALHPIAAQGFNLSLRDVEALAKLITTTNLEDESLLTAYLQQRQPDQEQTQKFTQRLVKIFKPQIFPLPSLRSFGLFLFDLIPSAKREFSWRRIGTNN